MGSIGPAERAEVNSWPSHKVKQKYQMFGKDSQHLAMTGEHKDEIPWPQQAHHQRGACKQSCETPSPQKRLSFRKSVEAVQRVELCNCATPLVKHHSANDCVWHGLGRFFPHVLASSFCCFLRSMVSPSARFAFIWSLSVCSCVWLCAPLLEIK